MLEEKRLRERLSLSGGVTFTQLQPVNLLVSPKGQQTLRHTCEGHSLVTQGHGNTEVKQRK